MGQAPNTSLWDGLEPKGHPRRTALHLAANEVVGNVRQTQLVHDAGNTGGALSGRQLEQHVGGKTEGLLHRQRGVHAIVLQHVAG